MVPGSPVESVDPAFERSRASVRGRLGSGDGGGSPPPRRRGGPRVGRRRDRHLRARHRPCRRRSARWLRRPRVRRARYPPGGSLLRSSRFATSRGLAGSWPPRSHGGLGGSRSGSSPGRRMPSGASSRDRVGGRCHPSSSWPRPSVRAVPWQGGRCLRRRCPWLPPTRRIAFVRCLPLGKGTTPGRAGATGPPRGSFREAERSGPSPRSRIITPTLSRQQMRKGPVEFHELAGRWACHLGHGDVTNRSVPAPGPEAVRREPATVSRG